MAREKITLYLDVDDTIIKSSETIIDILNARNNTHKSINDLSDWGYRSICPTLNFDTLNEIFASEEFFDRVKIDPEFQRFYKKHKRDFNFVFVSKGVPLNIKRKEKFLKKNFPRSKFISCPITEEQNFDKSHINMTNGIQIDDRFDCLATTTANVKILYKQGKDYSWNQPTRTLENLYITNTWKEIVSILEFALKQSFFMETID